MIVVVTVIGSLPGLAIAPGHGLSSGQGDSQMSGGRKCVIVGVPRRGSVWAYLAWGDFTFKPWLQKEYWKGSAFADAMAPPWWHTYNCLNILICTYAITTHARVQYAEWTYTCVRARAPARVTLRCANLHYPVPLCTTLRYATPNRWHDTTRRDTTRRDAKR